jgi:hypothetical protein
MIAPPGRLNALLLFDATGEETRTLGNGFAPPPGPLEGRIARRHARKKPSNSASAHLMTLSIGSPPWVTFDTMTVWTAWL